MSNFRTLNDYNKGTYFLIHRQELRQKRQKADQFLYRR